MHPFPFRDPEQLVEIYSLRGGQPGRLSMRELLDIQEQVRVLDGIAGRFDLGGRGPGLVLRSRFEWDWTKQSTKSNDLATQ